MILFKKDLVPLIASGQKTQTRRYWKSPRVKVGSVHRVNTSYYPTTGFTGLRIRILRVWEQQLSDVTENEAVAEGFHNLHDFVEYFFCLNGGRSVAGRKLYAVEFRREEQPA